MTPIIVGPTQEEEVPRARTRRRRAPRSTTGGPRVQHASEDADEHGEGWPAVAAPQQVAAAAAVGEEPPAIAAQRQAAAAAAVGEERPAVAELRRDGQAAVAARGPAPSPADAQVRLTRPNALRGAHILHCTTHTLHDTVPTPPYFLIPMLAQPGHDAAKIAAMNAAIVRALHASTGVKDSDDLLATAERGGLVRVDQVNKQPIKPIDDTALGKDNTRTLHIFDVSKKAEKTVKTGRDGQLRDLLCVLARLGFKFCSDEIHSGSSILELYIAILASMESDAAVSARTRLQTLKDKLDGLTAEQQLVKADAYANVMMSVPPPYPRPCQC